MQIDDFFSAAGDNALIGTAFMKRDTNILTGDEAIYGFFGQNFAVNIIDFIHEDDKSDFMAFVESCGEEPKYFSARCRHSNGEYIETAFIIRNVLLYKSVYIRTDILEVGYMAKNYRYFSAADKVLDEYTALNGDIRFCYDIQKDSISLTDGEKEIFSGTIAQWRGHMLKNGRISQEFEEKFCDVCDAIARYDGCGIQTIETSLFDKNKFEKASISYVPVQYNATTFYMTGVISRTMFPDTSMLDPLTGIYNKREIMRLSAEALSRVEKKRGKMVFVIIDLDHFKDINDTYGHMSGDRAVINAARIIKSVIGCRGCVGRIGGDEFFAFMPDFDGDHETLRGVLRSVREHIRRHFLDNGQKVTCSIGASCYPKDSASHDELFKLADYCVYLAKTKGRNRFVIYKSAAHGTPEEIVGNGMELSGYITEKEKTEHLISVINRVNEANVSEYRDLLRTVMQEIKERYKMDAVQYCPAEDNGRYAEVSDYSIERPRAFMDIYDTYGYKFEDRGYIALGNYMNSKTFLPDIADYMEKNCLCSLFIAPCFTQKRELTGIFVLTSKVQYSWSGVDADTLLALCAVMDRLV